MEEEKKMEERNGAAASPPAEDLVEGLIRAYTPLVYAMARQVQPRGVLDEDLLQCGLIGLWRAAERWDQERPFVHLARRCIRSTLADHLRTTRSKLRTVSLEEVTPGELGDALTYEEDLDRNAERDAILAAFPAGSRERALLLALLDGTSMHAASKRLHISRDRACRMARRAWTQVTGGGRHFA